jgi:putative DNA-invertase from lambdoid prophage Rac
MLCAIYGRVSTDDQTADLQIRECTEYCTRRGWLIAGTYVDTGWSGSKASRPQLNRLMKDASQHRFDAVMVWKLDRFGRSVGNFIEHLQSLESYGVRFMAITQTIDTDHSNPTSRLLMHIMAAFAEFERALICERVKAGMKAAKYRGVHCGRKRVVFNHGQVIDLQTKGKSIRQIAAATGQSYGAIHRVLAQQITPAPVDSAPVPA